MTIRENAVRDSVHSGFIDVVKIDGKVNPSDIFTKEIKDGAHFIRLRNASLTPLPLTITTFPLGSTTSSTYSTAALPLSTTVAPAA